MQVFEIPIDWAPDYTKFNSDYECMYLLTLLSTDPVRNLRLWRIDQVREDASPLSSLLPITAVERTLTRDTVTLGYERQHRPQLSFNALNDTIEGIVTDLQEIVG